MNILIIPVIKEPYKNQVEFGVDLRLIKILKSFFLNCNIKYATEKKKHRYDLLILTGGNSITQFSNSQKDKIRHSLDNFYYKDAIRKKIRILGICHGSQFIGKKLGLRVIKKRKVGFENIYTEKKNIYLKLYHDYSMISKEKKNITIYAKTKDNTIEAFSDKKKNIFGINWHPERNKKINFIDKKFFKILGK
jgi:putative glutamine amidotransferase